MLAKVKDNEISIDEAVGELRHLPFEDLGFARVDHHRQLRCGFCEVIYCPGKATEHIVEIFGKLAEHGNNILATRAEKSVFEAVVKAGFAKAEYNELARTVVLMQKDAEPAGKAIPIVTAGTADLAVATEAKVTAEVMGQKTELICDVGVAGLHRIVGCLDKLQNANVIVVVAGMEGALASVVGGMVSCPVIAVPTSVGYGASFEGLSALLTMLNSCAAGVTVVNIDNGFSAGFTASLINERFSQ